jgi:hypothetical protein
MAIASVLVSLAILLLAAWGEIERRRFDNFFTMATTFQTFEVPDATAGWDDPRELALKTLSAAKQIVKKPPGFTTVKILWFDSNPDLSEEAKQCFRVGMKGIGVDIQKEDKIENAKDRIKEHFDVIIANSGKDRFAYQLLDEIKKRGLHTPLVLYGEVPKPHFAREARCYGAVARATTFGGLFSAVIRAIADGAATRISDELCSQEKINPYEKDGQASTETDKPCNW